LANAGASCASAIFDTKEGTVRRADDLTAVLREKRGVLPVEWRSDMWTFVYISEHYNASADDK